jgi:hypothetical protein
MKQYNEQYVQYLRNAQKHIHEESHPSNDVYKEALKHHANMLEFFKQSQKYRRQLILKDKQGKIDKITLQMKELIEQQEKNCWFVYANTHLKTPTEVHAMLKNTYVKEVLENNYGLKTLQAIQPYAELAALWGSGVAVISLVISLCTGIPYFVIGGPALGTTALITLCFGLAALVLLWLHRELVNYLHTDIEQEITKELTSDLPAPSRIFRENYTKYKTTNDLDPAKLIPTLLPEFIQGCLDKNIDVHLDFTHCEYNSLDKNFVSSYLKLKNPNISITRPAPPPKAENYVDALAQMDDYTSKLADYGFYASVPANEELQEQIVVNLNPQ